MNKGQLAKLLAAKTAARAAATVASATHAAAEAATHAAYASYEAVKDAAYDAYIIDALATYAANDADAAYAAAIGKRKVTNEERLAELLADRNASSAAYDAAKADVASAAYIGAHATYEAYWDSVQEASLAEIAAYDAAKVADYAYSKAYYTAKADAAAVAAIKNRK